ncbi:uncharacterized protein mansc4 [Syngnathus typhle]
MPTTYDTLFSNHARGTMNVACGMLTLLLVAWRAESRCSPTSYYKNCWIRSFPGIVVDTKASEKQGARLLRSYREEGALTCSRSCCLTTNASCNVAVFHFDATTNNCCHLHCPTLESCLISHSAVAVLYNVTLGVDPDLLVFGKHLASNIRVGRVNASELLPLDKRQFFHPPPPVGTIKPTSTPKTTRRPSAVTPKPLSSSATTFQSSVPPPSSFGSTPTFLSTITTTCPLTSSTSTGGINSSELSVKEPGENKSTTQTWIRDRGTNNPSNQTPVKNGAKNEPSTKRSFQTANIDDPSTQTSFEDKNNKSSAPTTFQESDTEDPSTQTSVRQRVSTPDGEDTSADLGPGYHGLPVVLVTCVAALLGCLIWLVASRRAKRRRMECHRASGTRETMRLIKYDPKV